MKMIFAKNFARNCEIKIILGTSDAWSSEPALDDGSSEQDNTINMLSTYVRNN